jgi:hypothetical protein
VRPLAVAFAVALALQTTSLLAAPARTPTRSNQTDAVSNCDDSGAGSLRDTVGTAADGDTIDLSQLSCSVISLSTGAIVIGVSDLTLQGPGNHQLLIQGVANSGAGVLYDVGGGTLTVNGIDVAFGAKYRSDGTAHGGCIYSSGDLDITDAHVYSCGVRANAYTASGGALYASGVVNMAHTDIDNCALVTSTAGKGGGVASGGGVIMTYSTVTGCRVVAGQHGYGGGVYTLGDLTMKYSTIRDNGNADAYLGEGGGTFSRGNVSIYWSTISGNYATVGGGVYMARGNNNPAANISESTISGNSAQGAGGVRAALPLTLHNSTIAFNQIPRAYSIPIGYAPSAGLSLEYSPASAVSTIIANNVAYGQANDAEDVGGDLTITIDGSDNLIMSSAQPVPADTITADPQLAQLADNGGPTRTHALLSGSPAIDQGDDGGFATDQRGPGFARVFNGRADIGAFEVDADRIFSNGFD